MRRAVLRLAAILVALTAVVGCTSDPSTNNVAQPTRTDAIGAAATSSPAAELLAGLTALLVERTYVVAAATSAVVAADGRTTQPAPAAALVALDDASAALADVLGATYSEARAPLLEALRRDDRLLAQHAIALAAGDEAAAAAVRAELGAAQADLARVVRQVVPALDADELADRLAADLQAQMAATGPEPYAGLRIAADEAARTARLLAAGIADDRGLGSPGTGAVLLRADATALLTEHVSLVGALAGELADRGTGTDVRAALQANAEELADVVGEAYPAARAPFLRSWTSHLERLTAYAATRAAGGTAVVDAGVDDGMDAGMVAGYPAELARLLAEHVDGLPAQSSATELELAQSSLLLAVDAAAIGDPRAPLLLRAAVADVQRPAAFITAGMAEDLRLS